MLVALVLLPLGCAHNGSTQRGDQFVEFECVVEEYEPEALVFYDPHGLPYDAKSRVSRVRVSSPRQFAGRVYAIDLLPESERKDEGFEDLRTPGAVIQLMMPSTLTANTEREMIPVYELKRAPNKPVQSNSVDAPRKSRAVTAISRLPRSV